MVVKDKVGRKRYIVFQQKDGKFHKGEMIAVLNRSTEKPYLMMLEGKYGIVFIRHWHQKEVTEFLNKSHTINGKTVVLKTIKTSGTARKAKKILEELKQRE